MKIALLALCTTVSSAQYALPGANLWVRGDIGSDSNAGTISAPFATVGKANSVAAAGQVIAIYGCFQRYPEQITAVAGVSYVGWGSCPSQAYFDGADPISTGAWSKSGGYTNLYQATITIANASGLGFLCVYENGVCGPNFPYISTLAGLDAAASGYYVASQSSLTGTSVTVYVNATGHGSPATNGNLYECDTRLQGFFSGQSGTVVANILTGRGQHNNGPFQAGDNSFVSNVGCILGHKHNCFFGGGSTANNITATSSYFAGQAKNMVVIYTPTQPNSQDVTLNSPVATETVETNGNGFYGHTSDSTLYGTITVNSPNIGAGVGGISGFSSRGMSVIGGTVATGITTGSGSNTVSGVSLNGCVTAPYSVIVNLVNNVMSAACANGMVVISSGATPALTVTGNSFNNTISGAYAIYLNGSAAIPTVFTFTGNTVNAPQYTQLLNGPGTGIPTSGYVIDNNTYHYFTASATYMNWRGTSYNLATSPGLTNWRALGYDIHSTVLTP